MEQSLQAPESPAVRRRINRIISHAESDRQFIRSIHVTMHHHSHRHRVTSIALRYISLRERRAPFCHVLFYPFVCPHNWKTSACESSVSHLCPLRRKVKSLFHLVNGRPTSLSRTRNAKDKKCNHQDFSDAIVKRNIMTT